MLSSTATKSFRADISIVIVSWNARQYLEICLNSIAAAPSWRATEVIVVDNGSSDGSPDMVQTRFPFVNLIRLGENLGFAKANNIAIAQSRGRYVALVNSDVKLLPGCLDALADFLDHHPNVGCVGPRVLNGDMTLQSSCRRFPSVWNNVCTAMGLAKTFTKSKFLSGEHMLFFPHDRIICVDVLVGCFWMVSNRTIQDVGTLDEDFFMYGEDIDWCRRCWNAGWSIMFLPGAEAIHYRGGSSVADPIRCAVVQQRSILHYWRKHHSLFGLWGIRVLLFCHHLLRYLLGKVSDNNGLSLTHHPARSHESAACLYALITNRYPSRIRSVR